VEPPLPKCECNREVAEFTRKPNEFLDQQVFIVSRLQLVGFEAGLSNGVAHLAQILPIQSASTMPISRENLDLPKGIPPFAAAVRLISVRMYSLFIAGAQPILGGPRRPQRIVGITYSAPARTPCGQRAVTVLRRV
jgi:hypothetical protein